MNANQQTLVQRYGPQGERVQWLLDQTDHLDDQRAARITSLVRSEHAALSLAPVWRAAERVSRTQSMGRAMRHAEEGVQMQFLPFGEVTLRWLCLAARHAAAAAVTFDLVGGEGYDLRLYNALVESWEAGFPDMTFGPQKPV